MTGVTRNLPGIPHIESPFFDDIFNSASVNRSTRKIADDLRLKGYAVIDFPDQDIDAVADRIRARLSPKMNDKVNRIQDAWTFDSDVKRLAANQAVLDLLGSLYGRRAFPFQTLNFIRGQSTTGPLGQCALQLKSRAIYVWSLGGSRRCCLG